MSNNFGFEATGDEVAEFYAGEIKGKTIIITGCTWGGLGAETARVLVKHDPKVIVVAGRKQEVLDDTVQNIKKEMPDAHIRTLVLDLGSFKSIRRAAEEVNHYSENVDVLINNAAVVYPKYQTTEDGLEAQFGVAHIGHFLFTNLILSRMLATGSPRVVNVSSGGHALASIFFDDPSFKNGETYDKHLAYGQSKTANVMFAKELTKRYKSKGLTAYSLQPGVIKTNLSRNSSLGEKPRGPVLNAWGEEVVIPVDKWKTLNQGVATHITAAFDANIKDQSGSYLEDSQIANDHVKPHANSEADAERLWILSERLVGQKFSL
ncbi:hypothetical protein INT43_007754 [Umbelopsis isabellina]|uniref:NAD(P)-binding protein n=1 Tax=Mortierella isabellina TaxID=91625 RepID=A0A8H7UEM7_MORIS|nr:hypothetical protein INT43_007754 [Umbelopsis isabellina]